MFQIFINLQIEVWQTCNYPKKFCYEDTSLVEQKIISSKIRPKTYFLQKSCMIMQFLQVNTILVRLFQATHFLQHSFKEYISYMKARYLHEFREISIICKTLARNLLFARILQKNVFSSTRVLLNFCSA